MTGSHPKVRRRHGQPAPLSHTTHPRHSANRGQKRGSDPSPPRPAQAGIFTPWRPSPRVQWLDVHFGGGRDNTPEEVRWPRVIETAERLTAAGATVIREGKPDQVVMADLGERVRLALTLACSPHNPAPPANVELDRRSLASLVPHLDWTAD